VVATGAAVIEVGAAGVAVIVPPAAPVAAPVAATAGTVSVVASSAEFTLGLITDDQTHIRAGGFGMITYGFGRTTGTTARGLNVTTRQEHAVNLVTSFYETYGGLLVA
jgi:hypothetical protein